MAMSLRILVIASAAAALLLNMAMAANYNVGGPTGGWALDISFQAWANNITFMEGDTITFVYEKTHNVVEVTKSDYDACLSNASINTYNGGNTVVPLNSVGNRYFICGTTGHCDRGMKVVITTVPAPAPPPGTPSAPPAPAPSSPAPATPSGSPPAVSPVSSPAPKASSPAKSPKVSPSKAPVSSPSKSPSKSPAPSPPAPAGESPAEAPATPPRGSTPPSSANKITAGAGLVVMMLLAL